MKSYRSSLFIVFSKINIVYIVYYSKLYDVWIVYIVMAYDFIVFYDFLFTFIPYIIFFLLNVFWLQDTFELSKTLCTFCCVIIIPSIYLIISLIKLTWICFSFHYNKWYLIFYYIASDFWHAILYGFYTATGNTIACYSKFIRYMVQSIKSNTVLYITLT